MNALTRNLAAASILASATVAGAQSLDQRLADLHDRQRDAAAADQQRLADARTGRFLVNRVNGVNLVDLPAKSAFEFVATASGVPIIVSWQALEVHGVTPDTPVTLVGAFTGEQAMDILVAQLDVDGQVMWDTTEWFVRVITKDQASREQIVRVYDIGDLLQEVPNFTTAPSFDLVEVTRSPASGGGANQQGLFEEEETDENSLTPEQQGERIADLIRDTIEPDAWERNGGLTASVRYFNRSLIVRAPRYIHRQIAGDARRASFAPQRGAFDFGPGAPGLRGPVLNPIEADERGLLAHADSPARAAVADIRLP